MASSKADLLSTLRKLFIRDDLDDLTAYQLYCSNLGKPNFEQGILEMLETALFDPDIEVLDPEFIPNLISRINCQHFGES